MLTSKVFDLLTLFEPFTTPLCPQQTAKDFADTLVRLLGTSTNNLMAIL